MLHSSHSEEEYKINAFVYTLIVSLETFILIKNSKKNLKLGSWWGMGGPQVLYILVKYKILFSYYKCIDKGRIWYINDEFLVLL